MLCKICNSPTKKAFEHIILNKFNVSFYRCESCLFLQVEKPYWLDESYKEPINVTDTGYVTRNIYLARKTLFLFFVLFRCRGKYIDFAGAHGLFTRIMRNYGVDYYWDDIYVQNLFAQGFAATEDYYTAGTCFECFEHLENPIEEIYAMLSKTHTLFVSTKILPNKLPGTDWEYYSFGHGQHISFFSITSLKVIAEKHNLNFYTDGENLHLFTDKKMHPILFKFIVSLSRLPFDIIIKKYFLKSKMIDDQLLVKNKGYK